MSDNKNHLFTTGQVVGMLGISLSSLQLYIREYREHLSETATQQKQGRRFTGRDIECLMTIHNLRFRREKKSTIEAALQGDGILEPGYKVQDFATLAADMHETEARIRRMSTQIEAQVRRIEHTGASVDYVMKKVRESQDETGGEFETLEGRIRVLRDQITALNRKIELLEYNLPLRFSLWDWLADKFGG